MSEKPAYMRKRNAKHRFRAVIRKVMQNYEWLGDVEDEQLGIDFMKNIHLLTMKKTKAREKKLLSLYEKVILTKMIRMRTDEEMMHLARILSSLKCFRKYHPGVRDQLAASLYYVYYRPGRVIVKQFHEAHALYFIISGTVNVKQNVKDPILGIEEEKVIGSMEAGDMFGEVSLLHDIPRTATIETTTPCDLLMLTRKDFDLVLKNTVKAEWEQILYALKRFSYFDNFTEIEKRECCILSKIKIFPKDSIIVGCGINVNHVHFIVKGQASILVQLLTDKSEKMLKGEINYSTNFPLIPSGYLKLRQIQYGEKRTVRHVRHNADQLSSVNPSKDIQSHGVKQESFNKTEQTQNIKQHKINKKTSSRGKPKKKSSLQDVTVTSFISKYRRLLDESFLELATNTAIGISSDTKSHIMHVAKLHELACFGVGEDLKAKIIVADTNVTCLQIPYFWLMQRHKMVWVEIKNFWDRNMPSSRNLFNEFRNTRKWNEYKKKLCRKGIPDNYTFNVPYSIRIRDVEACSLF